MKVQVFSDIHMEKHQDKGQEFLLGLNSKNVDLLIIAGDLTSFGLMPDTLSKICSLYPKVVYVPGNHDYWGLHPITKTEKMLEQCQNEIYNLVTAPMFVTEYMGQRIVGATMWFQFTDPDVQFMGHEARLQRFNDFRCILDFYREMESGYFEKQREFLMDNVQEGDVVVTHHLPSYRSVDPDFIDEESNCFFVNDMEKLILEKKPKIWIHGHTHRGNDYRLGDTRIICNPMGRPVEMKSILNFKDKLIIDV